MLARLDPEFITGVVIFFITLLLIAGILLEYTGIYSEGRQYMLPIAGLLIILYGIGVVFYILLYNGTPDDQ